MKMRNALFFAATALCWSGGLCAQGQTYTEYKFVFKGIAYQTNTSGNTVGTHP